MSERVNKIILTKKECGTTEVLFDRLNTHIRLLVEMGYNCFISKLNNVSDDVKLEFCKSDLLLKDESIPQPCWLYQHELEELSYYQMQEALLEAKQTVKIIEQEIAAENSDDIKIETDKEISAKKKIKA